MKAKCDACERVIDMDSEEFKESPYRHIPFCGGKWKEIKEIKEKQNDKENQQDRNL